VLLSLAQVSPIPATDNVILSLERGYGNSVFSRCRVDIVVHESRGVATLWCDSIPSPKRDVPDLNARQELTPDETTRVTTAVRTAQLFDGGHVGADSRAVDGVLETLQVVKGGQAVVLVTSGNPTFERDGPRKQLRTLLQDLEKRLRERARD
jgi:hypothetical protein